MKEVSLEQLGDLLKSKLVRENLVLRLNRPASSPVCWPPCPPQCHGPVTSHTLRSPVGVLYLPRTLASHRCNIEALRRDACSQNFFLEESRDCATFLSGLMMILILHGFRKRLAKK